MIDDEEIELSVNDKDKLIAYDDYASIVLKGKEATHFHPGYDEMYQYFLDIMENREKLPTKTAIIKEQIIAGALFVIPVTLAAIFCVLIRIKSFFLKAVIMITFVIISFVVFFSLDNKLKNRRKSRENSADKKTSR